MEMPVHDDPERRRFVIEVDGEPGGFAAYRVRDGAVVITHTEVDPRHRGRGVGGHLARGTLDLLRERGDTVVPLCPFFAAYLVDHPEYGDLVDD